MHLNDEIKKGIACDSVGKPESVIGRTVCLSVHPGRMLLFPFIRWFDKRYRGRYKFARLLFSFDLVLVGLLLGLATTILYLKAFAPPAFADRIQFEATVAPTIITTGAPSTLVIRYTNSTPDVLLNAVLTLGFPDHFLLQEVALGEALVQGDRVQLGDIDVGETGTVHVKGVMFGDVGGEQAFTSRLTFVHGEGRDIPGTKTDRYVFSPARSALELTLTLPDQLIATQPFTGVIGFSNRGEIDFPAVSIVPQWPTGFTLTSVDVPMTRDALELPSVASGDEGSITFTGTLGSLGDEVTFTFHPSFAFGSDRYRQETLVHTAPVYPAPVTVGHSIAKATVQPGTEAVFTVRYANTGEVAVENLVVGIESDSPFFASERYEAPPIGQLEPGVSGEVTVRVPLRATIAQSETSTWEALNLVTQAVATYTLSGDGLQRATSRGTALSSPIITPVLVESFGRYATPAGDQIGRGPLPPLVGESTTYWVFWHVDGTINNLTDVTIEGTLSHGVEFTGRQTSSQNSGAEFDPQTGVVRWSAQNIEPTLSPTSKIVGVAFEVSLTPTDVMVGTSPTLVSGVRLTAVDERTGAFVGASGSSVSTTFPNDPMAVGKAVVEP